MANRNVTSANHIMEGNGISSLQILFISSEYINAFVLVNCKNIIYTDRLIVWFYFNCSLCGSVCLSSTPLFQVSFVSFVLALL